MSSVFEGVKVVEVAQWRFVPATGGVLAELGADVIKVEHPAHGDPQRGLVTSGLLSGDTRGINYALELTSRGKRSIGLDLASDQGHDILMQLLADADLFLTSFLPDARKKLRIDVADVRAQNSNIIYARGNGQGVRGPDAWKPAYDGTAFWARAAVSALHTAAGARQPTMQRPAFGDLAGSMNLAFGVAAALYRRARTGKPSVVDVSLLSTAMWMVSTDLISADLSGRGPAVQLDRHEVFNPLVNMYPTKDGRWINLVLMEAERYWEPLCRHIGRPDLAERPDFATSAARRDNVAACAVELDATFRTRTLAEWTAALEEFEGAWAPVNGALDVLDDVQVEANSYLTTVDDGTNDAPFCLVSVPVQFDEIPAPARRAPEMGRHTEEILLAAGHSWDEIIDLKAQGGSQLSSVRIAAANFAGSRDLQRNLDAHLEAIKDVAADGAELLVFPELSLHGIPRPPAVASGAQRYQVFESAESVASGSAARVIREAATEHRLTVAYGLVEHGEGIGDYFIRFARSRRRGGSSLPITHRSITSLGRGRAGSWTRSVTSSPGRRAQPACWWPTWTWHGGSTRPSRSWARTDFPH
jgi:crotonobetainyl-CoA:carnitine CoA-transferase CaiB-like acyl-CoA transferase